MSCGFGSKPAALVIYREVLVHCVHVSVQEYQKKLKMFQKKVVKPKYQDVIIHPEIQYMNIYSQVIKRLSCFHHLMEAAGPEEDATYFYGDATAYEQHLEMILSQRNANQAKGFWP